MNNRTIYHLSHIDLDGYSCQLVMKYTPYKKVNFNANYGPEVKAKLTLILDTVRAQTSPALILISDLNLTAEESDWLKREVDRCNTNKIDLQLTLLDHHGSGTQSAKRHKWYYLDTERCATKIVYDYVKDHFKFNEPIWMQKYVNIVNAVDLWKKEEHANFEYGKVCMRLINETRELNRIMFANEDNDYKLTLLEEAVKFIDKEDAPIVLDEQIYFIKKAFFQRTKNDTLDNLSTHFVVALLGSQREKNTIYYKGYKGYLSYAVGNTSIVGNGFLVAYPEYDFIVDVSFKGAISLRAEDKVSVAQISKEWVNGGGHPNAAGGRIPHFKEQYSYEKVKQQIEDIINDKEAIHGALEWKREE